MEQRNNNISIRKVLKDDNLAKVSELLYFTDPYIYPYWFENLENCVQELTPLLLEKKFFYHINHLYVAIDNISSEIVGVICVVDKNDDLNYDYSYLKAKNERYCFTIVNYIEGLIHEVKNADFAYISNVCVDSRYRGRHIGNDMLNYVIDVYKNKLFKEIVLDVLSQNPGAIKLYQNLGFEQFTEFFKGFNSPREEKPEVFSMKAELE